MYSQIERSVVKLSQKQIGSCRAENYCFSDQTELDGFELELEKENISFSRISDTTVNISKDNEEQADTNFYQITNNAIDNN